MSALPVRWSAVLSAGVLAGLVLVSPARRRPARIAGADVAERDREPPGRGLVRPHRVGNQAYTVQAVGVGAAPANDAYDRGGLELGVHRLQPDGRTTPVDQNRATNGDRVSTPVLPAGRYVVLAATDEYHQVYPRTGTMDIKTVQGSEGRYGVRLTESAAPPVVTSFSTVRGGRSMTGTCTLSAPAPAGGMYVDISSSHVYDATPGSRSPRPERHG